MGKHTSTKKGRDFRRVVTERYESLLRFSETLKLRGLSHNTQSEYRRYVRKLSERVGCDPATLDEAQVRAHLLHLKDRQHYAPKSMRTAVAAMRVFYGHHLGRDCRFDFAQGPEPVEGEAV